VYGRAELMCFKNLLLSDQGARGRRAARRRGGAAAEVCFVFYLE